MVDVCFFGVFAGIWVALELVKPTFFALETLISFIILSQKSHRKHRRTHLHYGEFFRKLQEKFFSVM